MRHLPPLRKKKLRPHGKNLFCDVDAKLADAVVTKAVQICDGPR